jgi:RNA polymerase sigma factor (TIGR02999 family)
MSDELSPELSPELYNELHRIAARYMSRERRSHTLQPTALVHEAYLRIVEHVPSEQNDRGSLLALAARVMRNVLVDHARRKAAAKRGGGARAVTLSNLAETDGAPIDLISLDECLSELAEFDEFKCRIVDLMFFAGLTIPETAETLGLGTRAIEKHWALARTWLRSKLA